MGREPNAADNFFIVYPPSAVNFTPTIYHTVLYREECNKSATRKQKSKNNQPVEKLNCPKIYGQHKKESLGENIKN